MTAPGVSGPGAMSKRTDLSPGQQPQRAVTGLPYGDGQAFLEQQSSAPMSAATQAADVAPAQPAATSAAPPAMFGDPTARPDEPVTHGADLGPGADSSILQTPIAAPAGGMVSRTIAKAAASDTSGVLQQLLLIAQQKGL